MRSVWPDYVPRTITGVWQKGQFPTGANTRSHVGDGNLDDLMVGFQKQKLTFVQPPLGLHMVRICKHKQAGG